MLASTRRRIARQAQMLDLAVSDARRASKRGHRAAASMIATYQAANIDIAVRDIPETLREQGLDGDAVADVNQRALLTPTTSVAEMLSRVADQAAFDRLTRTLVLDAGRTASSVGMAVHRDVTVYVREPGGACCSRCAVLAGRIYRYSTGFQRHPNCQCVMVETTEQHASGLTSTPDELFRKGMIHDLSRADTRAINQGADISSVVNVRRKQAGLVHGSSVMERAGRLTPAGIYRVASDRDEEIRLLRRYGYIH